MPPVFVVGDIHGQLDTLITLLRDDTGLIDADHNWRGADTKLVFVGDYFDRGPDGIGTVDLLMHLEPQAAAAGGEIVALLGNHDLMVLAVERFASSLATSVFMVSWLQMGGSMGDLQRLTPDHVAWLSQRPIVVNLAGHLIVHADATFYARPGNSVQAVNQWIHKALSGKNPHLWMSILEKFNERYAFSTVDWDGHSQKGGPDRARALLQHFGAHRIVHGHTPVFRMTGQDPLAITGPLHYCEGLVVNVDAALYKGNPGWMYQLPALT